MFTAHVGRTMPRGPRQQQQQQARRVPGSSQGSESRSKKSRAKKRLRKNIQRLQQEDNWQQQQERALEQEEAALLARQVYVTCLSSEATESAVKEQFSRYGNIRQVQLKRNHQKNGALGAALTIYSRQGKPPPKPRAVIEFDEAEGATALLADRRSVNIFSGMRNGLRTCAVQFVLPAGQTGCLREPCDCRRYRRVCQCPTFVKAVPHRPPRNQAYHRGGAGEHTLAAVHLQVGSAGPDSNTLITELDMATNCKVTFDLQQRCLSLEAPFSTTQGYAQHLLVIQFRHLRRSIALNYSDNSISFTARQPPKVLRKVTERDRAVMGLSYDDEGPEWQLAMDPTEVSNGSSAVGAGLAGAHGVLGRCLKYRLQLSVATRDALVNDNTLLRKLRSFKLLSTSQVQPLNQTSIITKQQWEASHGPCGLPRLLQKLEFNVGYHVQYLLSSGVVSMWQVSTPAVQQLLQQHPPPVACRALAELAPSTVPIRNLEAALQQQLEGLDTEVTEEAAARSTQHCTVLRVHVTTTRVKYLRPEPDSGNRVIRHFSNPDNVRRSIYPSSPHDLRCLADLVISDKHFLRVSFGDEHGDRLFDSRDEPADAFFKLMERTLDAGVWVNGRHSAFLAYSSSQLKTWSCWMVADPRQGQAGAIGSHQLAAALRYWMGDAMDTEKVPAKCAARLGQCFSTTVDGAIVQQYEQIVDVERYGYCYSDGVGRISNQLLDEVLEELPFTPQGDRPHISAIQIRFGGAKGVVSRFSSLDGRRLQLQLRPSQLKFGSRHPQLEVCAVAKWLPAYLNRQIIIMMVNNGADEQALMDKLEVCLDDLAEMCASPKKARIVLPTLGGIETGAHGSLLNMLFVAESCSLPLDPLLDASLRAIARWQVVDLLCKARLRVQAGAMLVGIMDEYGVLEEGEVFVKIQKPQQGTPTILQGDIVLAKNPVSHIGDVRRVRAVRPGGTAGRQLVAEYVNVVVFSQKGERPLPNMLSGSDLDGDQYLVLYDSELLQPYNSQPMDYTAPPHKKVDEVTVSHLQQHFVNFAKNDRLGQISTWLLARADKDGPHSPECKRLAELHSIAVDFPKTGLPAEIDWKLVPEEYPHYMERGDKASYHSDKILGKMYDRVLEHPITKQLMADNTDASNTASSSSRPSQVATSSNSLLRTVFTAVQRQVVPSDQQRQHQTGPASQLLWPEQLLRKPQAVGWVAFLPDARDHFEDFDRDVVAMMNHWNVYDLGEMLTGCIRRLQRRQGQQHQHAEQRDQLHTQLRELWNKARRRYLLLVLQRTTAAGMVMSAEDAANNSAGIEGIESMTLKRLEALVDERTAAAATAGAAPNVKLQCAAAYMVAAYWWLIKQQKSPVALSVINAVQAATVADSDEESDSEEPDSENDESLNNSVDAVDGSRVQNQQQGSSSGKDVPVARRVRLCFQWVVSREIEQLAGCSTAVL